MSEKKKYSDILKDVLANETPVKLAKGVFYDRAEDCYCLMGLIVSGLGFDKDKKITYWEVVKLAPEFVDREDKNGFSFLGSLMMNLNDRVTDLDDAGKLKRAIQLLEAEGL